MTDKTRDQIAEVLRDMYRQKETVAGGIDRIEAVITAQADGVTDEQIEAEAISRYPTNMDMSDVSWAATIGRRTGFIVGAKWLRSRMAAPKPD